MRVIPVFVLILDKGKEVVERNNVKSQMNYVGPTASVPLCS